MSPRRPTSRSKHRAKQLAPTGEKSAGKSDNARLPAKPFTGVGDPRNGRGPAPGAPNAGRPRKADRLLFRDIIVQEGIEAARSIMLGEQDRSGNVPTFDQRLAWFREIAALGFNEKVRLAKASAGTAVMQSGMQVILQGPPPGNLQLIE